MSDAQLFAGREDELNRLINLITAPRGRQIAVVGERGVGKTSLMKIAAAASAQRVPIVVKVNCPAGATFSSLWRQTFQRVTITKPRGTAGFEPEAVQETVSLAQQCPECPDPGDVLALLSAIRVPSIFAFDEFDRLQASETTRNFADLIKGLTDEDVPISLCMVGVADNVTDLFDMHASVERSLSTIVLPRMRFEEIAKIPILGGARLGLDYEADAVGFMTYLARGFPHIAHLLALHSAQNVLAEGRKFVVADDVSAALDTAMMEADPALRDRYQEATDSPRKDAQYRHVLAAATLVTKDAQGYFRPSDLVGPLSRILGKKCSVSSFTEKLNSLCDGRGGSLTRRGVPRRFRYRFTNPMMESYVLIQSLMSGLITREDLRAASE